MNKVILIGNLTRDPEMRTTTTGMQVCTFTLAVSRRRPNQQGQREADFINIVTWNKTAELCAKYLHKGRKAGVSGSLQIRSYEKDGQKRYFTEVIAEQVEFLDRVGTDNEGGAAQKFEDDTPSFDDLQPAEDDIPF